MLYCNMHVADVDTPNQNNQVYPRQVLLDAIEKFNCSSNVGQINMPDNGFVSVTKISHSIRRLYIEDNALLADVHIFNNQNGKNLISLMDNKKAVFRLCGNCKSGIHEGNLFIVKDFIIRSINAVLKDA